MISKILLAIFWIVGLTGAELNTGIAATADGVDGVYHSQKAPGPQRTQQPASEAASPSPPEKSQYEKGKNQGPTAPSKKEPVKPFEPTEKVKADQAIDFPADI
jgi:hypothetical protein